MNTDEKSNISSNEKNNINSDEKYPALDVKIITTIPKAFHLILNKNDLNYIQLVLKNLLWIR